MTKLSRKLALLPAFALLAGCYDIGHDLFTFSALEPIDVAAADSSGPHGANVELLTGTVWRLKEDRLLFFARQGDGWRSWQVDAEGLVRVPEWSTDPGMASDATGSIDSYEDFASNIPSRLTAAPDGVYAAFEAGKLHILSFIHLDEDAERMAFSMRPSAEAIAEFAGSVPEGDVISSTQDGVILFESIPADLLAALAADPSEFYGDIGAIDEGAVWTATDLPVPLDYDDTRGIEELRRAL